MSDIKIDGPSDYVRDVSEVLGAINKNRVGQIIVSGIGATGKKLTILPYDAGKAANSGDCNALTHAKNVRDAAPDGISGDLRGESAWYVGKPDDPRTLADERDTRAPHGLVGTGEGSDVDIFFSPDKTSGCRKGIGGAPDEVLMHELVHALRMMQGRANAIPTNGEGNFKDYDNEEEFLSIVVTNVYMSAKKLKEFRASHHGHAKLAAAQSTSAGFLANADNRRLLNIHKLVWQPTFWLLNTVSARDAEFNPFRELTQQLSMFTNGQPFR